MKSFKFLTRLIAVFGIGMMFTVSVWAADPYVSISNPVSVTEGNNVFMDFNITLTAAPSHGCHAGTTYSVKFETTTGGTSQAADFTAIPPTTITIPAITTNSGVCGSVTIAVPIIDDALSEADETVAARLIPGNFVETILLGTGSAAGIIIDDDAQLTISVNDASIAEQDTTVKVTVLLSKPAPIGGITMEYETLSATPLSATSPADYTGTSTPQSITIPEGASSYIIEVPIHNDTLTEGTERFKIRISNASAGILSKNEALVTIFDDESVTNMCSSYVGMITINEYQNNPNYFDVTHNKIKGNYIELKYIDALVKQHTNDDWNLTLYSTQTVVKPWNSRDLACTDPDYEIFQLIDGIESNAMGASAIVVLTDQNGNEVDFFNLNNAATYNQNCQSFMYDTTFSTVNPADKEFFRNPDGTGDWSNLGLGANSVGSRCLNIPGSGLELIYKQFDAIDDDETLPSIVTGAADVPLKTKITNNQFTVKILSLDTNTVGEIGQLQDINTTIKVYLANGTGGALLDPTGHLVTFNNVSYVPLSLTYTKAVKNAKLWFEYCQDSSGVLHNWDTCFQTINVAWQRHAYSRNSFAVRPNVFSSGLTGSPYKYTAGKPEGIIFQASAFGGSAATDYNETEHSSFVADVNISDSTKSCAQASINFSPSINFTDGTNVVAGVTPMYSLPNIGDFNVTIHEIIGLEYARIDWDDTPDFDRLIGDFNQTIKVVPDHFIIDANLTNGSNGFTYLSNFDGNATVDQNISALLDANLTAKAFGGSTTSNYTSGCYAKDGNVSLGITLPAITPSGNLTQVLWYDDINSSVQGNFPLAGPYAPLAYPALRFVSGDSNGTGNVRYRLNFDRNQTKLVDPFTMVANDVNSTDSDLVDGNSTLTTNNSAYYVYGRIIPRDIRVFGANTPFAANAWYEVYNASIINATPLPASRNESSWFINTRHTDTVSSYDGDGNVTVVINGANPTNSNIVLGSGMETYWFGNSYALGGYKAHINTDPWLWYGSNALSYLDPVNATNLDCLTHPCFNINIVPPVGATGSAKSGAEGNKASKKSDSSGWRSTTDYAPAVR
ncbi:MAG TPA: Calx-beta domain-containing protein [Sulfuricurvum sp.]|nr:Calx-beta domain-containing protein [Sulfuricurvum sp.]